MVRPTGASMPDVIGTESRREISACDCTANFVDEPAHDAKCRIHAGDRPASRATDRSAAFEDVAWSASRDKHVMRRMKAWHAAVQARSARLRCPIWSG